MLAETMAYDKVIMDLLLLNLGRNTLNDLHRSYV